jgi:uncharacterized protein (TIGR02246 family)
MSRRLAGIASVALAVIVWTAHASGQSLIDEQSIRGLATQFERAWNTHDMNVLGSIATDDIDFVNVAGLHWKGRAEVVKEHAERHKVRFKNSVWTTKRVSVQFVASDLALVHVEWETRGDLDFDLKPWPPRKGIFSWLVVKNNGSWRIRAAQNTGKN